MNYFSFLNARYALDDLPFDEGKVRRAPKGEGGGRFVEKPENALMRMGEKEGDRLDRNAGSGNSSALDAAYMDAVKRGDMETARRMVREVADRAGFSDEIYHQTNKSFNVFDIRNTYRSSGGGLEYQFPHGIYTKLSDAPIGVPGDNQMHLFGKGGEFLTVKDRQHLSDYLRRNCKGFAKQEDELTKFREKGYANLEHSKDLKADIKRMQEEWESRAKQIKDLVDEHFNNSGYDGVFMEDDHGIQMRLYLSSRDVKSADPVTFDDDGNVIPLSQRFNKDNPDIRY